MTSVAFLDLVYQAMSGEGVDRHLLGLKLTAQEAGLPTPNIFSDPSFGKVFSFKISTSQVSIPESSPTPTCYSWQCL